MRLSDHFDLHEFLPDDLDESAVPPEVLLNIQELVDQIMEPLRVHLGVAITVHDGYRPPDHNAEVGGVPTSDHLRGAAADFHAWASDKTWEENTIAAFHWLLEDDAVGQVILEDHRMSTGQPGKLWVHAAIKSPKHPGDGTDRNRVLVSYEPGKYEVWKEVRA